MSKLNSKLFFLLFFLQVSAYGIGSDGTCRLFSDTSWQQSIPISASDNFREVILAHYPAQTLREIRFEGASFTPDVGLLWLSQGNVSLVQSEYATDLLTRALDEDLETSDERPEIVPVEKRLIILVEAVANPHQRQSRQSDFIHANLNFLREDGVLIIRDMSKTLNSRDPEIHYTKAVILLPQSLRGTLSQDRRVLTIQSSDAQIFDENTVRHEEPPPVTPTVVTQPDREPPVIATEPAEQAPAEKMRIEPRIFTPEEVDPAVTENRIVEPQVEAPVEAPPPAAQPTDYIKVKGKTGEQISDIPPEPAERRADTNVEEARATLKVYRPVGTADRPSSIDTDKTDELEIQPSPESTDATPKSVSTGDATDSSSTVERRAMIYDSRGRPREYLVPPQKPYDRGAVPPPDSEKSFQPRVFTVSDDNKLESRDGAESDDKAPRRITIYRSDEENQK